MSYFPTLFTSRAWDTLQLWHPISSPACSTCSTTFFCMADVFLRQLDPPKCSLIAASRVAEHTAGSASTKTLQLARREAIVFRVTLCTALFKCLKVFESLERIYPLLLQGEVLVPQVLFWNDCSLIQGACPGKDKSVRSVYFTRTALCCV